MIGFSAFSGRGALVLCSLVAALLSCLATAPAEAAIDSDAVAYQNNPAHDGSATFSNFSTTPTRLWSVNLGHQISYPLIAQGEVYATVGDNSAANMSLKAVNVATGHVDWTVPLTSTYWSDTAAYENGRVFLYNSNFTSSTMNAYNAANGSVLWSVPLPGQYSFSSPPTAANGIVYTGGAGSGGTVYAYRETDGKLLWTARVENGDNSSPAVTSTGVYVSYSGPQTYDFNPTTGSQIWHYNSGIEGGGGKTPVYYNGKLYVRDFSGLTAFSAANGTQVAAFNPAFGAVTAPAFSNGVGYITADTSNGNVLDAFDPATGAVLWSKSLGGNGTFTAAPLVINNIVFAASSLGNVYEFDASGNSVGMFNVGNGINGPDEQNVSQPLTGLTAGDGLLAIPAGSTLNLYSVTPEPSAAALVGFAAVIGLMRRGRQRRVAGRL